MKKETDRHLERQGNIDRGRETEGEKYIDRVIGR